MAAIEETVARGRIRLWREEAGEEAIRALLLNYFPIWSRWIM